MALGECRGQRDDAMEGSHCHAGDGEAHEVHHGAPGYLDEGHVQEDNCFQGFDVPLKYLGLRGREDVVVDAVNDRLGLGLLRVVAVEDPCLLDALLLEGDIVVVAAGA